VSSALRATLSADGSSRARIFVDIAGRTFEEDLIAPPGVETNYAVLNEALATSSGRFAVWAMLEASARRQHDDAVAEATVVEARLFERYWNAETVAPSARGQLVKARVAQDADQIAAQLRIREAKEQLDMVAAGRKTIEKRGETLITISHNWRQEMQSRLQVRADQSRPTR
jgi:hypothetical protein